jgi:hypothetical protein
MRSHCFRFATEAEAFGDDYKAFATSIAIFALGISSLLQCFPRVAFEEEITWAYSRDQSWATFIHILKHPALTPTSLGHKLRQKKQWFTLELRRERFLVNRAQRVS